MKTKCDRLLDHQIMELKVKGRRCHFKSFISGLGEKQFDIYWGYYRDEKFPCEYCVHKRWEKVSENKM